MHLPAKPLLQIRTPWSSPSARSIQSLPAAEAPADAPDQVNDIKPGAAPTAPAAADGKKKKAPKADLNDESSSKKKKKKGLAKLNPF